MTAHTLPPGVADALERGLAAMQLDAALAAPLLLEMGRIPIRGSGESRLIAEAAASLLAEAGLA